MRRLYLARDAFVSDDGLYRYWLVRRMSMGDRVLTVIGLNPSTADALIDDPTIRRCVGFAIRWGYDWLYMGNLHAWRATNPNDLPADPLMAVGPYNAEQLTWICQRAETIVAAWGRRPLSPYASTLAARIGKRPNVRCFGTNADGSPKHPLYLKATTPLQPWPPAAASRA